MPLGGSFEFLYTTSMEKWEMVFMSSVIALYFTLLCTNNYRAKILTAVPDPHILIRDS